MFNSNHSILESNPKHINKYITFLEREIDHDFKVVGITEIGSFAKDEAVPSSDIDTRIYVSSPNFYLMQTSENRLSDIKPKTTKNKFQNFLKTSQIKQLLTLNWYEFNLPASKKAFTQLNLNIEFGLVDARFAQHELKRLNVKSTSEHQLLLESNIIFDPTSLLANLRSEINGKIYSPVAKFYQKRYLDNLPFEIYTHLEPHEMDSFKLEKSNQIQWVKWAVRSIRDAIGAKSYIHTGKLIYKKEDIFSFCSKYLAQKDYIFIKKLYSWKIDPKIRKRMINDYLKNSNKYFIIFKKYTKKIEFIVKNINELKNIE